MGAGAHSRSRIATGGPIYGRARRKVGIEKVAGIGNEIDSTGEVHIVVQAGMTGHVSQNVDQEDSLFSSTALPSLALCYPLHILFPVVILFACACVRPRG
jgi:hypothetical protein